MIALADRSAVEPDVWDGIVHSSDDGWVYALNGWQELILAVTEWGLQDRSFAVIENGHPVAVVPLQFNPASGMLASSGWGGSGPGGTG